jgi:polysaccharide biosynthesis protein PslG
MSKNNWTVETVGRFTVIASMVCSSILWVGCGGSSSKSNITPPPTSSSFFGMSVNRATDPWPSTVGVGFASWRTLGSAGVLWGEMNTAPGVYDFSKFDQFMASAQAGGQDVLFTAYTTPSWISSRGLNCVSAGDPAGCVGSPNTACAFDSTGGPGLCDIPTDINCDGTGTDQTFINFITAVVNHVGPGKIKYWEMWNEPNVATEWNADADCPNTPHADQIILARMANDLRTTVKAIDPNALFTTPAATGGPTTTVTWLNSYLTNTNGANFADIIAFHGYVQAGTCPTECPVPEDVATVVAQVQAAAASAGLSMPLFDTEGSWGAVQGVNTITDPDQQAAFLGRYYLLQIGSGVSKFYWYGWDFTTSGFLYDPDTETLQPSGVAYQQIVKWTSGNTVHACVPGSSNSSQWSCLITGSNDSQAEAVWDASQTCNAGVCTTTNLNVPSQFVGGSYTDLTGTTLPITSGVVPVGAKPILLTPGS